MLLEEYSGDLYEYYRVYILSRWIIQTGSTSTLIRFHEWTEGQKEESTR